jgi:hypothetical protein
VYCLNCQLCKSWGSTPHKIYASVFSHCRDGVDDEGGSYKRLSPSSDKGKGRIKVDEAYFHPPAIIFEVAEVVHGLQYLGRVQKLSRA